jgi:hypothetical protein
VLPPLTIVLIVSGQELTLQNVSVQKKPSLTMTKVNMNVNIVTTNVKLVKTKPPPVKSVKISELMLQTVTVHQVTLMFQIMLNVKDVLKNVKLVILVDLVLLVTLQDSMPHTVIAQPVNSKYVDPPLVLNVMITTLVLIQIVTTVPTNVSLVKVLLKLVPNVPVTESWKLIVVAQLVTMIPMKNAAQLVMPVVKLVNSPLNVV